MKPWGISTLGSIDGYLRRILWFEASNTNNNSRIGDRSKYVLVKKELFDQIKKVRTVLLRNFRHA